MTDRKISYEITVGKTLLTDDAHRWTKENSGKPARVTIELTDVRSHQQNRFFHGPVLKAIAKATSGHATADEKELIKQGLKNAFLKDLIGVSNKGIEVYRVKDTHELTVKEMQEFLDFCIRFLNERGGCLEAPEYNEYHSMRSSVFKEEYNVTIDKNRKVEVSECQQEIQLQPQKQQAVPKSKLPESKGTSNK